MLGDERAAQIEARAGELAADCDRWSLGSYYDDIANELAALVDELLADREEREAQRAGLLAVCKALLRDREHMAVAGDGCHWDPDADPTGLAARAAVARAEGREVSPSSPGG